MAKKQDGQMLERVKAALDAGVGRENSREGVNWINQHYGVRTTPQVFGRLRQHLSTLGHRNGTVQTQPLRTEQNPLGRPTILTPRAPLLPKDQAEEATAGMTPDGGFTAGYVAQLVAAAVELDRVRRKFGDEDFSLAVAFLTGKVLKDR